jgi:hypothetical protein
VEITSGPIHPSAAGVGGGSAEALGWGVVAGGADGVGASDAGGGVDVVLGVGSTGAVGAAVEAAVGDAGGADGTAVGGSERPAVAEGSVDAGAPPQPTSASTTMVHARRGHRGDLFTVTDHEPP